MQITFSPPLSDARDFPAPWLLALPKNTDAPTGQPRTKSAEVGFKQQFDQARSVLFIIGKTFSQRKFWLPAYHCPALVEPIMAAGAEIAFYPMTEPLAPDFNFLTASIQKNDIVVGIRYFGFDCEIQKLAELCNQKEGVLVEDLAHAAFFNALHGDIGVTSLKKFYPVTMGGELLARTTSPHINRLEQQARSLPPLATNRLLSFFNQAKTKLTGRQQPSHYRYFREHQLSIHIPQRDQSCLQRLSAQEIISRRQHTYRRLANALGSSLLGKPLFPSLPNQVTPYIFPFLLKDHKYFSAFRNRGIQALRWEEMHYCDCQISNYYRSHLIQLPCHQDISDNDLQSLIQTMNEIERML